MLSSLRLAACALAVACLAHGQGGSAIITLVMPPPADAGYAMLQDGGLFAAGASSAYYNPALLADLERNTGSQLHYSKSNQDLLPVLGIRDLDQEFTSVALVLPDSGGGTDLGVGYFRNQVGFGWNESTDRNGRVTRRFQAGESVQALAIGIRLGIPLSLGATAKFFDSELAEGQTSSGAAIEGRAYGWAFDAGAVLNPRVRIPSARGIPFLEVVPSFHSVLQNIGPDAFYGDPANADPLPLTWSSGMGAQLNAFDFLRIEAAATQSMEIPSRKGWVDYGTEPVRQKGICIDALFFQYSVGWMNDVRGRREEKHEGHSYGMDLRRAYRAWRRVVGSDFHSPPEAFDRGYPFAWTRVFGIPFRANPRFVVGWREIESRDRGIRTGQKAYFTSFSL